MSEAFGPRGDDQRIEARQIADLQTDRRAAERKLAALDNEESGVQAATTQPLSAEEDDGMGAVRAEMLGRPETAVDVAYRERREIEQKLKALD